MHQATQDTRRRPMRPLPTLFALGLVTLIAGFAVPAVADSGDGGLNNPYRFGPGPKFSYKETLRDTYVRIYGLPQREQRRFENRRRFFNELFGDRHRARGPAYAVDPSLR